MAKQQSNMIRILICFLTALCIYSVIMSINRRRSIQPSLLNHVVPGLSMNRQRPSANKKTNGVISIDFEEQKFYQTSAVFQTVYTKLKEGFKDSNNRQITRDYTAKYFAKRWRLDFEWLALRAYVEDTENDNNRNRNPLILDPAWLCIKCNKYFSDNSTARISSTNTFANPNRLFKPNGRGKNPPQKNSFQSHERSKGHDLATGGGATESDINVFTVVYLEAQFNVPFRTHPFWCFLIDLFNGDIGQQLHSPSTAKKITITVGLVIKAALVETLKKAHWLCFGSDGGEVQDSMNLFWIWVRCVVKGEPIQFFWAARHEVRQLASYLMSIFIDSLNGNDMKYGYNYSKKIELEAIEEYNAKIKLKAGWKIEDLKVFKPPSDTKILMDFDRVHPNALRLGEICALSKTITKVSDGANNEFGNGEGFAGRLGEKQVEILGTQIFNRVHCIDHEWDLHTSTISNTEGEIGLKELADRIEECRKVMNWLEIEEEMIRACVIWDVHNVRINKHYKKRWLAHLEQATKNFNKIVDVFINVIIKNLMKNINKNNQRIIKKREKLLSLLVDIVENTYWDSFIVSPVIGAAATLSVKQQAHSKTCIDAANIVDEFAQYCREYDEAELPEEIEKKIGNAGDITDPLFKENIEKLAELSDKLIELDIMDDGIVFDTDYEMALSKGKKLADEYLVGIDNFKSYKLWCKYREFVCLSEWNTDDINEWYATIGKKVFMVLYKKVRLKVNKNSAWRQYKKYVDECIELYVPKSQFDYYLVVKLKLNNSLWCERNPDLTLMFHAMVTEGYSNSFAEFLVHIGDVIMPDYRKRTGTLLLESICHIQENAVLVDQSQGIVKAAIDFWHKAGYHGADVLFGKSEQINAVKHVEAYLDYDFEENGERKQAKTDYKRRLQRKQHRQELLREVHKDVESILLSKQRIDRLERKEDE